MGGAKIDRRDHRAPQSVQNKDRATPASTHTSTRPYMLGGPDRTPASTSGTARPIVSFKHVSSVVSVPFGSGAAGALALGIWVPFSAVVSLYPSSVRTTLLAR